MLKSNWFSFYSFQLYLEIKRKGVGWAIILMEETDWFDLIMGPKRPTYLWDIYLWSNWKYNTQAHSLFTWKIHIFTLLFEELKLSQVYKLVLLGFLMVQRTRFELGTSWYHHPHTNPYTMGNPRCHWQRGRKKQLHSD